MDVEQLNTLSYKELQAHAKQLSIPANQKKEILVQEILALGGVNNENSAVVGNKVVVNVPASVTKAPVTPLVNRSVRVTRSTAKKALVVEESNEEAPVAAPAVDDAVDDCKVDVSSPQAQTPVDAKPVLPLSTGKNTVCFAEVLELGPCESYNEEYNEEDEDEEYPNPTNLFEAEEELENNLSALEITSTPKAPVNKHVYFTSPELSMGNAVHWNYEDYSKETEQGAQDQADDAEDARSEASAESETEEASQQSRMKLPAGHGDRVMNFWLTKAFAMPPANYFK